MGADGRCGRGGLPLAVKQVALYYPWIYLRGGAERNILELVRRSRHEYTVFTNHVNFEQTYPEFRTLERLVVLDRVPMERSFDKVILAALRIATLKLDLRPFDALLVSSEGLGDFITFRNHARPVVCFCHTPVRPVYDPVYRRVWLERHPRRRLALAVFSLFYAALTRRAWRHYRRVFVNGREVQARIAAGSLCPMDRVEVLHSGVDAGSIRHSVTHDKYFLYVGRIKWTKNVTLAVQAFREFKRSYPGASDWRLVVAGNLDRGSRGYLAELERMSHAEPAVTYRLNPSTEELDSLYDCCYAVIFPSLNEDWGLVPIEAMAHGKPVVAVNSGGPAETVLDGETGYLLEPTPGAFAARMAEMATDSELVRSLGARATERARLFTWDRFVQRLDDYIDQHC